MRLAPALLAVLLLMPASRAAADLAPPPPVNRIAFAPSAKATVPLDAIFFDETGTPLRLGDLIHSHPVVLVPAYYGCSNLCSVVLAALAAGLDRARLRAGRDVDVIVFSIDPLDTPVVAARKKRSVLSGAASASGWHFLTGRDSSIDATTRALGYRYAFDASEQQYAHPAGVAIVAPDGRIVRTILGVDFPVGELRAAIADAGRAELVRTALRANSIAESDVASASPAGRTSPVLLLCFHYDPRTGRYTFAIMNAVRTVALLSLLVLVGYVFIARWREGRSRRR